MFISHTSRSHGLTQLSPCRSRHTDPSGLRAGAVVLAGAVVVGLALRAGFTGRLPLSFAVVTALSLAVLLLGWRALSLVVARRAAHRVP